MARQKRHSLSVTDDVWQKWEGDTMAMRAALAAGPQNGGFTIPVLHQTSTSNGRMWRLRWSRHCDWDGCVTRIGEGEEAWMYDNEDGQHEYIHPWHLEEQLEMGVGHPDP